MQTPDMPKVGKCFLFYLKYSAEMERVYVDKNFAGLPDDDGLQKRIELVGDTACREAAELLDACAKPIEKHFRKISSVRRRRTKLEENWELSFKVAPRVEAGTEFSFGVFVDVARSALLPWIWRPGGRRAAEEMQRVLSEAMSVQIGSASGSVILDEVRISVPPSFDEDVPIDPIASQIGESFARFTADHVDALASIRTGRESANNE